MPDRKILSLSKSRHDQKPQREESYFQTILEEKGNNNVGYKETAFQKGPLVTLHPIFNHRLDQDVTQFLQWINPTMEERELREKLVKKISRAIKGFLGDCSPILFGSVATNTFLPNSDIDIVILGLENSKSYFNALASHLEQLTWTENIQVLGSAKVSPFFFLFRWNPPLMNDELILD